MYLNLLGWGRALKVSVLCLYLALVLDVTYLVLDGILLSLGMRIQKKLLRSAHVFRKDRTFLICRRHGKVLASRRLLYLENASSVFLGLQGTIGLERVNVSATALAKIARTTTES